MSMVYTLSEVCALRGVKYTAATVLPSARTICPERAFRHRWQEVLAPLEWEPPVSMASLHCEPAPIVPHD